MEGTNGTYILYRQNGTKFEKSFTRENEKEILDIQAQLRTLGILENNVKDVSIVRNTNEIILIRVGQSKSSIGLSKDILLKDYLIYYLYEHRKNGINGRKIEDSTFNNYFERAKYIEEKLGNKQVRELIFEDFEELINDLNKKYADSSVKQVRALAENLMYYAKKDGIVEKNVLADERINIKERKEKKEKKIIQRKDIDTFVNYCKEHNYYILLFLLGTGCRASEAAGVTWKDIDFENGTVNFNKQHLRVKKRELVKGEQKIKREKVTKDLKTKNSYRTIKIDKALIELLKVHREGQKKLAKSRNIEFKETDFVFTTKTYKGYVADYTTDIFRRTMNAIKITDYNELTVHCLRHTYCSLGIMNKVRAEEMRDILGQGDIDVTVGWYTHLDKEHILDTSGRVASGIFG